MNILFALILCLNELYWRTCCLVGTTGDPWPSLLDIWSEGQKSRTVYSLAAAVATTLNASFAGLWWAVAWIIDLCQRGGASSERFILFLSLSHMRALSLSPFQVLMMHLASGYAPGSSFSLIHILHEGSFCTQQRPNWNHREIRAV